jgi:membrane-associated phospholipid phosphatase
MSADHPAAATPASPLANAAACARRRRRRSYVVVLWIVAILVALAADRSVTAWVGRAPLFNPKQNSAWKIPKRAGEFQYIIPVIVLVAIFHRRRWRGAVMLLVASGIAGAAYSVLKWTVGRARPNLGHGPWEFDPFAGGIKGFVTSGNLAFPSGHTTFAFAIAGGLAILIPKWRWAFYVIASGCAAQRVLEYAHHPSDVVFSAALGVLSSHAANGLCKMWFPMPAIADATDATPPRP